MVRESYSQIPACDSSDPFSWEFDDTKTINLHTSSLGPFSELIVNLFHHGKLHTTVDIENCLYREFSQSMFIDAAIPGFRNLVEPD